MCALQAVAGLGPRRPRRAYRFDVRAAGRRGAGAPPAERGFELWTKASSSTSNWRTVV